MFLELLSHSRVCMLLASPVSIASIVPCLVMILWSENGASLTSEISCSTMYERHAYYTATKVVRLWSDQGPRCPNKIEANRRRIEH